MDLNRNTIECQGNWRKCIISTMAILAIWLNYMSPVVAQGIESGLINLEGGKVEKVADDIFNIIAAQNLNTSTVGLYDRGEWSRDWNNPLWENGLDKTEIADANGERVLRFNYPEGAVDPFDGGAQWLAPFEKGLEEVYFSYNLMFKPGFEWVLGGKLPGLGGGNNPGGGRDMAWDDGFSVRIMWSKDSGSDGTMFFYVYHQDKLTYYGDVFSFPDTYWDVSDSTWYNMTIRLVINSLNSEKLISDPQNAGNYDGIIEFFLDGKLALSKTGLRFRNLNSIWVDTRHITSFFGGGTPEWGPVRDEWLLFDDSYVFTYKDGVDVPRGRVPSQPGATLQLPNLKGDVSDPADQEAPTIPANLRLSNATGHSLGITWDPSTDNVFLKGYRVMFNGTEEGTSVSNSFTRSGLEPNTSYDITVSAYDASGNESQPSSVLSASTIDPDIEPPSTPGGLLASEQTEKSVTISWTASTDNIGVTEYGIYVDNNPVGSSLSTSFSIGDLTPSTSYSIEITALDAAQNESAKSEALVVQTKSPDLQAPSSPKGIIATLVTKNSIGLVWNPSTDNVEVKGYRHFINGTPLSTSPSNSFTITGLSPGIEYSVTVSAYDASFNESAESDPIFVTTKNPDESSSPALPDVSIVEVKKASSSASMVTAVNSFGHVELKDYGLLVTAGDDTIQDEQVIYATNQDSKVIHPGRVTKNLQVLYDFSAGEGNWVSDISGVGAPLDLLISDPLTIDWLPGQGISIKGNSSIFSTNTPVRLLDSITDSNEITMEAWIRSDEINQDGPARIISLSKDNFHRAATLGYVGNFAFYNYIARLNTTATDMNGAPEISTDQNFISLNLHHVVYVRASNGTEKIYVNSVELMSGTRLGDFSSMSDDYQLVISNELGGTRPWLGTFYLAAIYNKALSQDEIIQNFIAGPGEIQFTLDIQVEPNKSYDLSPFARTDQGVVYGDIENLKIENVLYVPGNDSMYMAIYPNPSDGDFKIYIEYSNIGTPQVSIRISDMHGRLVYSREIEETDEFVRIEESFNKSSMIQSGIYAVIMIVGTKSIARRLLIHG